MQIDRIITKGVFSLDGQDFDVENNIWLLGNDKEVVVVDAAHDHRPIQAGIAGRDVRAIICTHGHNDHINAAAELADAVNAPIWLHPDDTMLWEMVYPDRTTDRDLVDGEVITVGSAAIDVIHTPGHSPGSVCLSVSDDRVLFSGDTLFNGGPGATGRSFSSHPLIVKSIVERLFALPDETLVNTGHGDATTIGAEKPNVIGSETG